MTKINDLKTNCVLQYKQNISSFKLIKGALFYFSKCTPNFIQIKKKNGDYIKDYQEIKLIMWDTARMNPHFNKLIYRICLFIPPLQGRI